MSARDRAEARKSAPVAATVRLRAARAQDCRRVWLWRNDPVTREASFNSAPIAFSAHEQWFRESLGRQNRRLYVVLVDGREAGVARLDLEGSEATVSIHLGPEWRGRRVGPAALEALEAIAFGGLGLTRLVASVKPGNSASLSAFRRAGFRVAGSGEALSLIKVRRDG